jgi:hypothetical protein
MKSSRAASLKSSAIAGLSPGHRSDQGAREDGEVNLRKELAELMAERDRIEAELNDMFGGSEEAEEDEALEVA